MSRSATASIAAPVQRPRRPPMRIAHLIHTMAHGGVETALINWMKTFDRSLVDPHLLCFSNPGATEQPFVDAAARAGFDVQRIPWGRLKPIVRAARATADYVRAHGIELLHCHNAYADAVGLLTARMVPVKTVTTVYVWSKVGAKRRVLQWIDERMLPHFDQITAHCQAALDDTAGRGIASADRIRLLTCGFAERVAHMTDDERTAQRAAMGVSGETVLINVARFWPEKRHDVLLDAFEILQRTHPQTRLWLPGVGPEEPRVRELVIRKNLQNVVSFLGFRVDLPELLALSDVQVHTSDEEGVPLAILAGMAAARPIVSTRVGGIAEVMMHNRSGVLVPRRDPVSIAAAISGLMSDPRRAAALGAEARRFVENEYSLAAATGRVESLYADMLRR